ncbi:MAG: hypothetical protein D6696_18390 [Acidobacteria bacterium]|nr:MAG: hypothetical protein D6696_18390 [Acidobacteriota bacterium]
MEKSLQIGERDPTGEQPEEERHIGARHRLWLSGLASLDGGERRLLLGDLFFRCPACWGWLEELATGSAWRPREGDVRGEPVALLIAWLIRALGRRPSDRQAVASLRPAAAQAARHARSHPAALGRLLVELARRSGRDDPVFAIPALLTATDLLAGPSVRAVLSRSQQLDLECLAQAYLEEAYHRVGVGRNAHEPLADLDVRRIADPEIRATVLELRIDVLRRRGQAERALGLCGIAWGWLERSRRGRVAGRPSPPFAASDERLAESCVRRGTILLALDRFDEAAETLRRALHLTAIMPPCRLRFDAAHLLAVCDVKRADFGAARHHQGVAGRLMEKVSVPRRLRAEHDWLAGLLAVHERRHHDALRILLGALRQYLELGRPVDAARVWLDLLPPLVARRDRPAIAELTRLSRDLAASSRARRYLAGRLSALRAALARQGLLMPALAQLIAELGGDPERNR